MKRILIISHEFPPSIGGAGTYSFELGVALLKNNISVLIIAGESNNQLSNNIDEEINSIGGKVIRVPWRNESRIWFLNTRIYTSIISSLYPLDLIIFANYTSHIIGSKIYQNLKCPFKIVVHGDDVDYYFKINRLKDKIMFRRDTMINYFKNAEEVIAVSKYLEDRLLSFIQLKNTKVVHHGLSTNIITKMDSSTSSYNKTDIKKKLNIPNESYLIVYTSRIVFKKGHDTILKVLKRLLVVDYSIHIVFIGDGEYYPQIRKMVSDLNLVEHVHFTGNLSREEVMKYYSASDLSILLSRRTGETFGIVLIEAMLMGIPVIGSNIGGIPEVINQGEDGFIVEHSDVNEITDRILFLIKNKDKSMEMGRNGRKRVIEYFNSERMALETIS